MSVRLAVVLCLSVCVCETGSWFCVSVYVSVRLPVGFVTQWGVHMSARLQVALVAQCVCVCETAS